MALSDKARNDPMVQEMRTKLPEEAHADFDLMLGLLEDLNLFMELGDPVKGETSPPARLGVNNDALLMFIAWMSEQIEMITNVIPMNPTNRDRLGFLSGMVFGHGLAAAQANPHA